MRRKQLIAPLILLSLLAVGCIKKSGTTAPVTPWEKVTTDNAILAQALDTLEQGAEAAVITGVMPKAVGGQVIGLCGQAANIQMQANQIFASAPNVTTANLATLQTLFNQVNSSAQALITSGQLGIKNPKSQQLFSADVQAMISIANIVVADIQAAKGAN